MATSTIYPSLTGAQTDFTVSFEYLDQAHVKAAVNGVAATFTFLSTYVIRMDEAPVGELRLFRDTQKTPMVTYSDGSILVDDDLNLSNLQALYIAEETAENSLSVGADGHYDVGSARIRNLGDPVDATDATNGKSISTAVLAVAASEAAAAASESNAATSASNAAASASGAASSASGASSSASAAAASEAAAAASAAAASGSASAASGSASNASISETNAGASASAAASSASAAASSESNAGLSASVASASGTAAASSENNAAVSAAAAATSETNAAASAAAAATSETNAAASAAVFDADNFSAYGTLRNKLLNSDGHVNQRGSTNVSDDAYAHDRHVALMQSGSCAVSTVQDVAPGVPDMLRLLQSNAGTKRFGYAQILEDYETRSLRGRQVTLGGKVRLSAAGAVRFAVLEWTGTRNQVTSDVVNNWASGNYSANNFFVGANLTVRAVGRQVLAADTLTNWSLVTTIGTAAENLIVFYWTEDAMAQNVALDQRWYLVEGDASSESDAFSPRPPALELMLCKRYFENLAVVLVIFQPSHLNTVTWLVEKRVPPSLTTFPENGTGATFSNSLGNKLTGVFQLTANSEVTGGTLHGDAEL